MSSNEMTRDMVCGSDGWMSVEMRMKEERCMPLCTALCLVDAMI